MFLSQHERIRKKQITVHLPTTGKAAWNCYSGLRVKAGVQRKNGCLWRHTGLYSLLLSEFLIKKGLFMWLENPLQIKLSTGIKRDKNDRTDSRAIALYAFRFQDKARCYQLPDAILKPLAL